MVSVVIAAHNEAEVIDATLRALLRQSLPMEIIVSANACTDDTVEVATRPDVVVIDRPEPGKPGALNAGDELATSFPRIYLDADIVVPTGAISAMLRHFDSTPAPLAVVPRRRVDAWGRPWPVRAYFAINQRLPVFRNGLFGRGLIVLSREGRGRFAKFPELIADDLYLDAQFGESEKIVDSTVEVVVQAPWTTRELVRRLARVRRGNAQLRAAYTAGRFGSGSVRPANRVAWFKDVVLPEPRLAPSAACYLVVTLASAFLARRRPVTNVAWDRHGGLESARTSTRIGGGQ
jgi:glycosyltransferase involved in cell wall biosynthesis